MTEPRETHRLRVEHAGSRWVFFDGDVEAVVRDFAQHGGKVIVVYDIAESGDRGKDYPGPDRVFAPWDWFCRHYEPKRTTA